MSCETLSLSSSPSRSNGFEVAIVIFFELSLLKCQKQITNNQYIFDIITRYGMSSTLSSIESTVDLSILLYLNICGDLVGCVSYSFHDYFHTLYVVLGAVEGSQRGWYPSPYLWGCKRGEPALT